MPDIDFTATKFGSGVLRISSRTSSLSVSRNALYWGLFTVGVAELADIFDNASSFVMHLGRSLVAASHLVDADGSWAISPQFSNLIQVEQGISSYWLGMGFAKIAAEFALGVDYLVDVERLEATHTVVYTGNRRPDLVGRNRGLPDEWHVIEAKARRRVDSRLRDYAKAQARSIASINGVAPVSASVFITRLTDDSVQVEAEDPKPDAARQLTIDSDAYLRFYYDPIFRFIQQSNPAIRSDSDNRQYVCAAAPWAKPKVSVGMWQRLYLALAEEQPLASVLADLPAGHDTDQAYVGGDGVWVAVQTTEHVSLQGKQDG